MPIHGGFMVHVKAKCQKGKDCQGPGCKIRSGKTRRNGRSSRAAQFEALEAADEFHRKMLLGSTYGR